MKDTTMKFATFATALILSCTTLSASALEMTATAKDVNTVDPEINVTAQNAAVVATISKVNKDVLAILKCNNKNMFFKPHDSTADADGCVGASISTTTTTQTVALPDVAFNSYPGYTKSSKGYKGYSYRYVDLSALVADGAQAVSVKGTRGPSGSNGWGSCGGSVTMNIANVNTTYGTTSKDCHYDNSPNRHHYFNWSYNGTTKQIEVVSRLSQTSNLRTGSKITDITATYTVTKVVLKVGDGK
jgi:hypothetical protein